MHTLHHEASLLQLCQDATPEAHSCTAPALDQANLPFAATYEPLYEAAVDCRLVARLADASRKAEEYAALGMFQEAAETAATVSLHSSGNYSGVSLSYSANALDHCLNLHHHETARPFLVRFDVRHFTQ